MTAVPQAPPLPHEVAKAVLALIQVFLKTGYYQPGHPETEKAREGLYETVTELFTTRPEITFMANVRDEQPEVLVGGVAHDYLTMRRIMPRNMADMFLPKLVDYFRRKKLSSFSLCSGISRYEFDTFIDIMTRSGWLEDSRVDARTRMAQALVKKEVINVSVVFIDDLVGHGRKLPWRVEATLARLKRDLNMLPLYRHVDARAISLVRQQVFEEIVRPLQDPILIRDLLVNLDLIIETLHDFDRDTFLVTLVEHIDPVIVPHACHLVIDELGKLRNELERRGADDELRIRVEDVRWVARQLGEKLLEAEQVDAVLFHAMVKHKVYLFEEIPPDLSEEILSLQAMHTLLENQQRFFTEIAESSTPEILERKLWRLLEMLPELLRQGYDLVARHVIGFAVSYGETFSLGRRPELVDRLRRSAALRAEQANRESVDEMLKTLAALDRIGLDILADLADHENRSVRRLGLEALAEHGQMVVPVLFAALEKKQGWHFLRNMLVLLARIAAGGPKVEKLYRRCLVHPQPQIRREAVQGLARLCGKAAEEAVAGMLWDTDIETRQRAVGALAKTGISRPKTIGKLAELLGQGRAGGEAMALQVVSTLNKLRPGPFADSALENALVDLIKPKGFFGLGGATETALTGPLREGAVQALGYVGRADCRKILEKLQKEANPGLQKILRESLSRLEGRRSSGP